MQRACSIKSKWLAIQATLGAITMSVLTLSITSVGYSLTFDSTPADAHGVGSGEGRLRIDCAAKPAWARCSPTIPRPDLMLNWNRGTDTTLAVELGPVAEPIGGVVGGVAGSRFGPAGAIAGEEAGRKIGHNLGRDLSKLHHRNSGFFKYF